MKTQKLLTAAFGTTLTAALAFSATSVDAEILITPTGVTATSELNSIFGVAKLIDNSGLDGGPDTIVGNLDDGHALSSTPNANSWASANGTLPQTVTFDLGGLYTLTHAHIWNYANNAGDNQSKNITISFSTSGTGGTFSSPVDIVLAAETPTPTHAQTFTLPSVDANAVRFAITSRHRGTLTGLSEVKFSAVPEDSFDLIITPATAPDTGFDLEWKSQAGKLYNLRTSTDLADPISDWTLQLGDIAATPPANVMNVPEDGPRRFYAVEEFDAPPPPPIFEADFEAGESGFTVVTAAGTGWALGTPDSTGPGGTVIAGNDDSANGWGTGIGNPGFYENPTTTTLRSPVIDLTGVAGATLTFAEALDLAANDEARVFLVNADTNTDIGGAVYTGVDGDINNASWAAVGPIDISAGAGLNVRLEWRFSGQAPGEDYMGWYIDNVLVTATAP